MSLFVAGAKYLSPSFDQFIAESSGLALMLLYLSFVCTVWVFMAMVWSRIHWAPSINLVSHLQSMHHAPTCHTPASNEIGSKKQNRRIS